MADVVDASLTPDRVPARSLRRVLACGVSLLVLAAGCHRQPSPSTAGLATPPLILVITIDSLRWDALGTYGDNSQSTPSIDRLASRSHVFDYAYATSSWTKPSMASMLTGASVSRHLVYLSTLVREPVTAYLRDGGFGDVERMYLRGNVLPAEPPLFHELLDGYRRAAFVDNVHLRRELGFARGWDEFHHYRARKHESGVPGNARRINADVLRFLDRSPDAPAVVWIHYFDVHWPYGPIATYGETYLGHLLGSVPDPYTYGALEAMVAGEHAPDSQLASSVLPGLYRAGLRAFDDTFSEFLTELERRGLVDPALIVVTSDHGDEFFEHGVFGHGHNLFDTTVRIPLLIKLPGQEAIRRYGDPVSLTDVGPTILDVCERLPDGIFEGRSLLADTGGVAPREPAAVFELVNLELENFKGVADRRHKLIVEISGGETRERIFDRGDDFVSLGLAAGDDAGARLRQRLLSVIGEWDPRTLLAASVATGADLPERIDNLDEIIEQLEALGYVPASDP